MRMVTLWVAEVVPVRTDPKSREVAVICKPGPTPVPWRRMRIGPALVLDDEVAVNMPAVTGENMKKYLQEAPGATPPAQFWVTENGGETPPPAKLSRMVSPVLVIVTSNVAPVAPIPTGPKSSSRGVIHRLGAADAVQQMKPERLSSIAVIKLFFAQTGIFPERVLMIIVSNPSGRDRWTSLYSMHVINDRLLDFYINWF